MYDAVNNVYFCEATDSIQCHPPNANLECECQTVSIFTVCLYVCMYVQFCTCMYVRE